MLHTAGALRTKAALDEVPVVGLSPVSLVVIVGAIWHRAWQLSPASARACGESSHAGELLACEAGCLVVVVLSGGEHVPDQHGELAGHGGDCDVVGLAACQALEEGSEGSGGSHQHMSRFDTHRAGVGP